LNRVERWREWNLSAKRLVDGVYAPDVNDELLLYQSLLGAWPLDPAELPDFHQRMQEYMLKAVREAKRRTSWRVQNDEYEEAVSAFTAALIARSPDDEFWADLREFAQRIAWYGALNSIAQLVIRLGAPGIPDFYQGCESWAFTLVDPDNRRPVDYKARQCALTRLDSPAALLASWRDGRIKLAVTQAGLKLRAEFPALFVDGAYVPVRVEGTCADLVIAFIRRHNEQAALFVITRWVARLVSPDELPVGHFWQDTRLCLEPGMVEAWRDALTGHIHQHRTELPVSELLSQTPFAMLVSVD
jgi:(1->4)-alpha-D-glucan 1-alpha-D-glucosylmutase